MSDDSFDDSLLDDYESTETGVVEPNQETEGSLQKGLLFGIAITIVLELGVGLALNVQTNLVHRYIAFLLGLIPIFVAAIFTRSVLKMFFIGAPVLILASFGLPFLLPNIFSGLMTPFLTLLPIVNAAAAVMESLGQSDPQFQEIILLVNRFGIAIDFLFGIFVGLFAAIGLTGIVKLVTEKPGVLSIFTFIFSAFFLLLGVIILPYVLVVTSGVAHFTLSFGVGGALLGQGTEIATDPEGNLTYANELFAQAEQWFGESEAMLDGLQKMGVFQLIARANPQIATIVDNGVILMSAAVDLAQGVAPALAGFGAISRGMDLAMNTLNNESTSALLLSQSQTDFERGLDFIELGFQNFTDSVDDLKDAIDKVVNEVDREALESSLEAQGAGDVTEQMNFIFSGLPLLNITLDVFTNPDGKGLIDDPDGIENDEQRAPLVHLLLGAKAMNEVQEKIGENSDFAGTGPGFKDLIFHLQFTVDALDPANNPAVADLQEFQLDESAPQEIVDLKDQITGTVTFLKDAGNTTISIGRFGVVASPTLESMNSTLQFLTTSSNFTAIPSSDFDNAINVFDGNSTIDQGIVKNATRMQDIASNVRGQIDLLETNANTEEYGFFNDPALEFATQFRQFNLTKNADNFFYISTAFSSLLKGTKELTVVDKQIAQIEANVTIIRSEINEAQTDANNGDAGLALGHIENAKTSVEDAKLGIVETNDTLEVTKIHLFNSSDSFLKTKDMPQLAQSGRSLESIANHTRNIQIGNGTRGGLTQISASIGSIETAVGNIEAMVDDLTITEEEEEWIDGNFTRIFADLDEIQLELEFISNEFDGIQSDLTGVSIAS